MEPAVSLSAYAAINGIVLIALTLVGYERTALWIVASVGVWAAALFVEYALRTRGDQLPAHRVKLDKVVGMQLFLFATAVIAASFVGGSVHVSHRTRQYVEFLGGAVVAAFLSVWLSALIDWFWILPRLAGFGLVDTPGQRGRRMHRPGPCQATHDDTWNSLTKVWLFHRSIATLFFIGGLAAIPGYLTAATHDEAFKVVMGILTLGVPAVMSEQAAAAVKALTNGLNPSAPVGSIMRIRMLEIVRVYLVDVSLQGSKFKRLDWRTPEAKSKWSEKSDGPQIPNDVLRSLNMAEVLTRPTNPEAGNAPEKAVEPITPTQHDDPDSVATAHAGTVVPSSEPADAHAARPPCDWSIDCETCTRINWYCRYNALAYSRRG